METATATTTTAIANSAALAAAGQYFLVMDMALISHTVYKLKDRVGSCNDARTRDADVVRSLLARQQREEGPGHGGK
jgi:hypothetical protein